MFMRTLFTAAVASATLAFSAGARAAYLDLGMSNSSDVTTTLKGSTSGPELLVRNDNGSADGDAGIYGLLTATAPAFNTSAVRGVNNSTTTHGYGVRGSQAGSGIGVLGFTPSGSGVRGTSTNGTGVVGASANGAGVHGQHTATSGTAAAVLGDSASTADEASGVYGLITSTSPGIGAAAVRGQNNGTGDRGFGVEGIHEGSGYGVYGYSLYGGGAIGLHAGQSGTLPGVWGFTRSLNPGAVGVRGTAVGGATYGVYGVNDGTNAKGFGVFGTIAGFGTGVGGVSPNGTGVAGQSTSGYGVYGSSTSSYAGYFFGNVRITGTCCSAAANNVEIDDPLDPAHKYLQHSSVASSQQLDIYSGNVTTNAKGVATVTMPKWFQALNRSFRYQLTIVGGRGWNARVVKPMADNRFTVQSDQPKAKVSWQVTAVRHDRYANAHPVRIIVSKPRADQGKYVSPELYGQPKTDAIGYRKPPQAPSARHSR